MNDNKILLIIGASSDLGCELIRRVHRTYDYIWVHYCHMNSELQKLIEEMEEKLLPIQADFIQDDSTEKMIETIKDSSMLPNHIVHFSAEKTFNIKFSKVGWETYQNALEVSLHSIIMILQAFLPNMCTRKEGKIIFMLSSYVIGIPPKYQTPYVTVKYALLGLMKCLAAEYAEKGIAVNGVSPDMIETKFVSEVPELVRKMNAESSPLKRNLEVADVVPALVYLLSEKSNSVTGINIPITGGRR